MGKKSKICSNEEKEDATSYRNKKRIHMDDDKNAASDLITHSMDNKKIKLDAVKDVTMDLCPTSKTSVNKKKNYGNQPKEVNEEDQISDKDIDEFCDDLDDEANLKFESWVMLLEKKLSGGKKSSGENFKKDESTTSNLEVNIKKKKKKNSNSLLNTNQEISSTAVKESSSKKNRNKSCRTNVTSDT